MAQFWIAIFFIFLAVAQLYQSIKDINLPLPVYLVLGVMLAVASNSQQQSSLTLARQTTLPEIEESDPILSLIPAPTLTEDIRSIDTTPLPLLLAAPSPPPAELEEIPPVNDDAIVILLSPSTAVESEELQPVDSDVLPILSTASPSLPIEITLADNPSSTVDSTCSETLVVALSPQEAVILDDDIKLVTDDINPVHNGAPPVAVGLEAIPPQTEDVKPVTRKTSRKKSTSTKKPRK